MPKLAGLPSLAFRDIRLQRIGAMLGGTSLLALFASGEAGLWIDPSDLTTLFRDTAGTQPVTAAGQSVALVLDKSKGLALGPELVTNGDFSAGTTGWVNSTATIASAAGELKITAQTASPSPTTQSINGLVVGKTYAVTATYRQGGSGGTAARFSFFGMSSENNSSSTPITRTILVVATATSATLSLQSFGTSSTESYFDNVSVKELPGNHATQATPGSRPTYQVDGNGRPYLSFDGVDDFLVTPTITPESALTPIGPELVTNGDFSAGSTGWTPQTGWTISGGAASVNSVAAGTTNLTSTSVVVTAGKTYQITYTVSSVSGSGIRAAIGGATEPTYRTATGTFTVLLTAVSTASFYMQAASTNTVGSIDNVSVKEMSGVADKVQVFAGVRKLSDAARSTVVELGNGVLNAFRLEAPNGTPSPYYSLESAGSTTGFAGTTSATYAAPNTSVLTGLGDISGDTATLRINGNQVAQGTTDQGTGNYLANPLYIGRRGGTTLPFNGQLFGLVVRFGANLDTAIQQTETWMNGKTGAY